MKNFKKLFSIIICTSITLNLIILNAQAGTTKSWFIKRNGNSAPTFPFDAEELSSYQAYCIDHSASKLNEKKLYLTFDAGYENGNIESILNTLKQEKVAAAFFILKNLVCKNPDLIQRMANEGHLICNHTSNHKDITNATESDVLLEINELENICKEKTGIEISKYFRFPEGKYSEKSMRIVSELGYKTVFWSFAYEDWDNNKQPSREYAINKIISNTHDGAIILLHPTSKTNADILPELIKRWRELGYEFYSLDHLIENN